MRGIEFRTIRTYNGVHIHDAETCSGLCPFDNPSPHKMKNWPKNIRLDSFSAGLVERMCPHGVGHPDPDSVKFMTDMTGDHEWGSHGCDGCCVE